MVPPLELKLNRVICPKSVATSKTSFFLGGTLYLYCFYGFIWDFPKMGIPPSISSISHGTMKVLSLLRGLTRVVQDILWMSHVLGFRREKFHILGTIEGGLKYQGDWDCKHPGMPLRLEMSSFA